MACFFLAQSLATIWADVAVSVLYPDGIPPLAERAVWTLLPINLGLWIGYFFGPILINRVTNSGPMTDFGLRVGGRQALMAVVLGVGVQLVVLPALYWVVLRFTSADPGQTAEQLVDRADGVFSGLALVVAVVIIAPVVEEWFYRGMLLSALARRTGAVVGAVVSSLIFALIHGEPILIPGLFVFALSLSWLRIRTGRLGLAIIAHMAFNATTVIQLMAFN